MVRTSSIILLIAVVTSVCPAQDSLNISLIGLYQNSWGDCNSVTATGDIAVVGAVDGIHTVSVTDIYNPVELGFFPWDDTPGRMQIHSDLVYVSYDTAGVKIIDISDPVNPVELSTVSSLNPGSDFDVEGDYLYIPYYPFAFRIYDISDPGNPVFAGEYYHAAHLISCIEVENNIAYIAGSQLELIDVSDPANPSLLSSLIVMECADPVYYEEHVYVCNSFMSYIEAINVSDPRNPVSVGAYFTDFPWQVMIDSDVLYVLSDGVIKLVSVQNPASMFELGDYVCSLSGYYYVRETVLYMCPEGTGLNIVDTSDPQNITLISSIMQGGDFIQTIPFDNYVISVEQSPGFRIFDVSDPGDPLPVSQFVYGGGGIEDLDIENGVAACAYWEQGMVTVDISDPANPVEMGFINAPFWFKDVEVLNGYAYLCTMYQDFIVVNIGDPYNPYIEGTYDPGFTQLKEMASDGNYAYISESGNGIEVLDISNPSNPFHVTYYDTIVSRTIFLDADLLFVNHTNRLVIIDVIDPVNAQALSSTALQQDIWDIWVEGDFAIVTISNGDVHLFDISDPVNPELAGYYTGCEADDVALAGDYIYAGCGGSFKVMQYIEPVTVGDPFGNDLPLSFSLSAPYPNPFNDTSCLEMHIPASGNVRLSVYDMSGRKAASLLEMYCQPGRYEVKWDAGGLASGVYFIKLSTVPPYGGQASSQQSVVRKAVLLK